MNLLRLFPARAAGSFNQLSVASQLKVGVEQELVKMAAPAMTLTLGSLGVPTQAHKAFTLQPTSRFLRPSFPSRFIGPNASPLAPSKSYTTPTRGASFKTAVASIESDQLSSSDPANMQEQGSGKYYFVVANAKFMLDEEEHFKELLFERLRYYGERSKEQDFWLVIEPKFLDKFPNITKRLRRPAVALVSTNGPWITFMKLRLDRVLSESYEAVSLEEALASNPTDIEFEKPENWVAPYPKYEFGWWEPFLPPGSVKPKV